MGPTSSRRIIAEPIEADSVHAESVDAEAVHPAISADPATDSADAWHALATDFPDLIRDHVDLVEELEAILRGDFRNDDCEESDAPGDDDPTIATDNVDADIRLWIGAEPEAGALAFLADEINVGDDEVNVRDLEDDAHVEPDPDPARPLLDRRAAPMEPPAPEPELEPEPGFWKVDETAWTAAPAWREPRRTRRADIIIIGGLVLLIAGGGAYSAFRVRADDGLTGQAATTLADTTSRAEAGLGAPFTPVRPLADDPAAVTPSLAAAITGAEVDPLPEIVAPPVEATFEPIFTAAADAPDVGGNPGGMGGPFVPLNPQTFIPPAAAAAPRAPAGAGMTTTVTTWVNMRASPDNAAAVVTVVPPDTIVTVGACDYWCDVIVNGQAGFIFKDFLVAHP